jgi:hypothetical protein
VYDQARAEFLAVAEFSDTRTLTSAKFLRDTAENALNILKDELVDPDVISELKETCSKAASAVVTLSGGKTRKFDELAGNMNRRFGGLSENSSSTRAWDEAAEDQSHHGRGGDRGDGRRPGRGYDRGYERGPERDRGGRRGPGQGRGSSGVPFVYTRVVDSYQPY